MNNGIRLSALLFSLGVLNIFGVAQQPGTVTLVSSDGQKFIVPRVVAELSEVIKNFLELPIEEDQSKFKIPKEQGVSGVALESIIRMLTLIDQQMHIQVPRAKTIRIHGRFIAQNVQPIIDPVLRNLQPDVILQIVNASNFLDLPFLANAAARVYVDKMVAQRPDIQLASLESVLRNSGVPEDVFDYFKKHLMLKKFQVRIGSSIEELSIGDYIGIYGQPEIKDDGIDLSEKNITSLEGIELIKNSKEITNLNLSNNKIVYISPRSFVGLHALEELNLRGNQLQTLSDNTFVGLNKLEELDLSKNQLQILPNKVFAELHALEELYLRKNQLQTLPDYIFGGLKKLFELDLSKNQLQTLSDKVFGHLNKLRNKLRIVDLKDNPFTSKENVYTILKNFFANQSIEIKM